MLIDALIAGFLVLGGFFGFVGSLGLVKLPDPMTRLHAPTKLDHAGGRRGACGLDAVFRVQRGACQRA